MSGGYSLILDVEGSFITPSTAESAMDGGAIDAKFFSPLRYIKGFFPDSNNHCSSFMVLFLQWVCQYFFVIPPQFNSSSNRHLAYSDDITPLGNRFLSSVESQDMVRSSVIRLLVLYPPFTIFRGVISIIINAFKAMIFSRSATHIFKKIIKRGHPMSANRYPSCPIMFVTLRSFFEASQFHGVVSSVLRRIRHAVGTDRIAMAFFPQAPAGFSIATFESVGGDNNRVAARAGTHPLGVAFNSALMGHDRKSAKGFTGEVLVSWGCHNLKRLYRKRIL